MKFSHMPVFPIQPNGKQPLTEHGFHSASADPAQIAAWEAAFPGCNWAFEPETASLCVVDLDAKNDGPATWNDITLHEDAPPTYTVATPGGGWHLYYRGSLPSSAGKLGRGIDTRGRGSYVLIPPSSIDGRAYRVVNDCKPAPLPAWIAKRVNQPVRERSTGAEAAGDTEANIEMARARLRDLVARGDVAIEGEGGDDRTYRLAAELINIGLSVATAHALLIDEWNLHCQPPWDDDELWTKIENAAKYAQNEPGSWGRSDGAQMRTTAEALYQEAMRTDATKRGLVWGAGDGPEAIEWLWQGWLARGKFHVFGGEAGIGKSTIAYDMLARLTTGAPWPDGSAAPQGNVFIWSGEDAWRDTILPRLILAGANLSRVCHIERVNEDDGSQRPFDPATDMWLLAELIAGIPDLLAILLDPIVSLSRSDSHHNAETRRDLAPAVYMAEHCRAALLGITHFSKNTQGKTPLDRITGSLAFGAVPRLVIGAVHEPENSDCGRIVRIKSNIGPTGGGIDYRLYRRAINGHDIVAQGIHWGTVHAGSAKRLIDEVNGTEKDGELRRARNWLTAFLITVGDAGALIADIENAARADSISRSTLHRARQDIGTVQRISWPNGGWAWTLREEY